MAVLNFEGFEAIGTSTGTGDAANVSGRLLKRYIGELLQGLNGAHLQDGANAIGYSLAMDSPSNWIGLLTGTNQPTGTTLVIGMRFRSPSSAVNGTLFALKSFNDSVVAHIVVSYLTTGAIRIWRDGTPLETSTAGTIAFDNTWYHLEAKINLHNTTGSYDVRVNGVSKLLDTGVDTVEGDDGVDYVAFQNDSERIDDLYVLNTSGSINNDFLGVNTRVQGLLPIADGANTDWTPTTGLDHYAMIDEDPESNLDYVSSGTLNDVDTFDFANTSAASVYAVKATANMMTSGATVRDVRLKLISGVTTANGPTEGISFDRGFFNGIEEVIDNIWETDPNTGSAWVVSNFNSAEFGVEVMS